MDIVIAVNVYPNGGPVNVRLYLLETAVALSSIVCPSISSSPITSKKKPSNPAGEIITKSFGIVELDLQKVWTVPRGISTNDPAVAVIISSSILTLISPSKT